MFIHLSNLNEAREMLPSVAIISATKSCLGTEQKLKKIFKSAVYRYHLMFLVSLYSDHVGLFMVVCWV